MRAPHVDFGVTVRCPQLVHGGLRDNSRSLQLMCLRSFGHCLCWWHCPNQGHWCHLNYVSLKGQFSPKIKNTYCLLLPVLLFYPTRLFWGKQPCFGAIDSRAGQYISIFSNWYEKKWNLWIEFPRLSNILTRHVYYTQSPCQKDWRCIMNRLHSISVCIWLIDEHINALEMEQAKLVQAFLLQCIIEFFSPVRQFYLFFPLFSFKHLLTSIQCVFLLKLPQ